MADAAVFFLEETPPESSVPVSLAHVRGRPVLCWTVRELWKRGVRRFFAAAPSLLAEEVRACFPQDADLTVSDRREDLTAFLSAPGTALVFPRAALPVESAGVGLIYEAPCEALLAAWQVRLTNAVQDAVPVSGWIPVYSHALLRELEPHFCPQE